MTTQELLWWIHERMVNVHGESEIVDYMHRLRSVIYDTDPKQQVSNIARCCTDASLMRERFKTGA